MRPHQTDLSCPACITLTHARQPNLSSIYRSVASRGIGLYARKFISHHESASNTSRRRRQVWLARMRQRDACWAGEVSLRGSWIGFQCCLCGIALSQLCNHRVGTHLCLHYPWADSELQTQLSYMGGRPQLSHILPLPSRRLGRYQIILLDDRGTHVWTTCLGLLLGSEPARSQTHDLAITSPTR